MSQAAHPHPSPLAWHIVCAIAVGVAVIIIAGVVGYRVIAPSEPVGGSPPPSPTPALRQLPIEKPEARVSASGAKTPRRAAAGRKDFVEDFDRAMRAFRDDRFAEASREFRKVAARYPDAYAPTFYLGVSLLLDGQPVEAVEPLRQAESRAGASARDEVRWYLAAALQRADRGDEARGLLRGLCEGTSKWRDRACRALS